MRLRICGSVAALAALVAGCGTAASARIVGTFKLCGGPSSGHCYLEPARVTVRNRAGDVVASEHVRDGRFSFSLPSGRYTVSAGGSRASVRAVAGAVRRVNIINGGMK